MTTVGSGRYRSRGLPAALVILSLLGPVRAAGGQVQLDGEYGLWVTDSGGELGVGWLLSRAEVGVLEVFSEGRIVHRVETPLGQAHFTTFPRPSGDTVLLRYGALEAEDSHATVLYLGEEAPRVL